MTKKTEFFHNARCVICNSVNSTEISTEEDDFISAGLVSQGFHLVDSYGRSGVSAFICHECEGSHRDTMEEFQFDDDYAGWSDELEEESDYDI